MKEVCPYCGSDDHKTSHEILYSATCGSALLLLVSYIIFWPLALIFGIAFLFCLFFTVLAFIFPSKYTVICMSCHKKFMISF